MKRGSWRLECKRLGLRFARAFMVLGSLALPAATAWAAEYHGQVMFGGVPVPGATVTLTQGDKHVSTVTDSQGLYQFPELAEGTWKIRIEMRGFAPQQGEATVSASTPQGAWELDLLSLPAMLAQTQVVVAETKPLQPRTPVAPAPSAKAAKPAKKAEASAPGAG